jgi:hypothetical protein
MECPLVKCGPAVRKRSVSTMGFCIFWLQGSVVYRTDSHFWLCIGIFHWALWDGAMIINSEQVIWDLSYYLPHIYYYDNYYSY